MAKLDIVELNDRGDADFLALNDIEKDLYVLLLFSLLRDMEGITHFYSYHAHHAPRLVSFLAAVRATNWHAVRDLTEFLRGQAGDSWEQKALDDFFLHITKEDDARISEWEQHYDAGSEQMWTQVKAYVQQHFGIEID